MLAVAVALAATGSGLAGAVPRRAERPVPAFEGTTLGGERLSLSEWIGRRFLLAFLDPADEAGAVLADAVVAIQGERADQNFRILAVTPGGSRDGLRRFLAERGLDAPVLIDAQGQLARSVGLRGRIAAIVVDAEGYMVRGTESVMAPGADPAGGLEAELRRWLRLPSGPAAGTPTLGERPAAPDFEAPPLEGGEPVTRAALAGRPAVLIFFLHTCPHCHEALEALRSELAKLPEEGRPALYGISVVNRPTDVRRALEELDLDFLPVLVDPADAMQTAYGATGGVPTLFLIDAEGRIAWRFDGWREQRDPALLRMRLALLAGQTPPMLLHSTGYSGNEFCATCHRGAHDTWLLTTHAGAYDTLVRHGAERDEECIGCHVVGFGKPGGFDAATPAPWLEGVGCETCHGRGGPHLSPGHTPGGSYETACLGCHDAKHSLGFDYATFLPKVSHAANAALAASLSLEEKRALLAERGRTREALLPTRADYTGSGACRECHAAEHATWSAHPHARALETLAKGAKAGDAECLACHTTGYGKGGMPEGVDAASHSALAGVGCESCHGPGGDHVGPDAARTGTILALRDKCDSCVILQICGSCHDDANDPGFRFEVEEKIERQRHGTIPVAEGG